MFVRMLTGPRPGEVVNMDFRAAMNAIAQQRAVPLGAPDPIAVDDAPQQVDVAVAPPEVQVQDTVRTPQFNDPPPVTRGRGRGGR